MSLRSFTFLLFIISSFSITAFAQDRAIGQWRSHLPYNTSVSVAVDDVTVYVATKNSFYTYGLANEELTTYSKVSGMSDVGMSKIAHDKLTGTTILAYTNSNIDLFKDGNFSNIPDLKIKTVTGTKTINNIYTEDGLAYLSTDIGIVVLNLDKEEVKETYTFSANSETISINSFKSTTDHFYAATNKGLYRILKSNKSLQAFSEWEAIDTSRNFIGLSTIGSKVYVAKSDSVFSYENGSLTNVYTSVDTAISSLNDGVNSIWILENDNSTFTGTIYKMEADNSITDTIKTDEQVLELVDIDDAESSKWIAYGNTGLKKRTRKGAPFNTIQPEGPNDVSCMDISVINKEIAVAHGGYNDIYSPLYNAKGFSVYKDGEWEVYANYKYAPFGDSVFDVSKVLLAPNGDVYAGSQQSGLFILKQDGSYEYYKQNSFIDPSSTGATLYRVSGLAFDNDGVFWLTVYGGTPNELVARTQDGQWHQFSIPAPRPVPHAAVHLTVDDYNQKWFGAAGGGGCIVYDDNHTPADPTDDRYRQLLAGEGSGGLPENEVHCIEKDNDGSLWIGTSDGIGIISCPGDVIDGTCEAEKRIVQFDEFAGYLFQNEIVKTIAVDGGNRKWIGTNNGVWLVNQDGDEILERFTKDNSPLPSNIIQKIIIDPTTGDVYFGTEQGLVSYRGEATQGGEEHDELITYPNPVPSGYGGTIAIKGFAENADVRITDISGQLVYRTKALGGQAVWNGKDYTGARPQSGVYLIFGSNQDGSQTVKGKLVFME